ncbi:MAG: 23S rRNA (guanosine(2251)-2'-O)-methyltransferase RlmB [Deltaproteobacteria bacterium]|nr:23S rRNA (guanosine(2251)-2'-O)-methyltransferase RlmB [Deltaproteobacteria bacterium]
MKFTVYGINPVVEALRGACKDVESVLVSADREDRAVKEIILLSRSKGIEVKRLSADELTRISGNASHQGVAAFLKGAYPYRDIEDAIKIWKDSGETAFFLVLDSIHDPQNMGSLIRSALAAGVHAVIVPRDRSCPVTAAVVKASAGAAMHAAIARVTNLREAIKRLKEEGVWATAVELGSEQTIYASDLKGDIAIVIGSEGEGIRRLVREECDFRAHIPMRGAVNSLNAAQAGAVALFEARRQKDGA